MYSMRTVSS